MFWNITRNIEPRCTSSRHHNHRSFGFRMTEKRIHQIRLGVGLLLLLAIASTAEKTNKIIVKIKPGTELEVVEKQHPFVNFEFQTKLPGVFVFSASSVEYVDQETEKFVSDPHILWAQVDELIEDEPMSTLNTLPFDESFLNGDQWFHEHINSSYAWSLGFSGQGQLVQVIDTPFHPHEKDFRNQIDFARSFEGNVTVPTNFATHGTICANIIAAEANDYCGVGVAFSSRIAGFPFISNPSRRFDQIEMASGWAESFSVSSNSFGRNMCRRFGCNLPTPLPPVYLEAFELAQQRNNTVLVFASGNEARQNGLANFNFYMSTPRIIGVGSTTKEGTRASYSNPGSANWIVAPAGDHGGNVTWTSAMPGGAQTCGEFGVGTSWSAPMVSGAAAILKSAFPALTWRDIKLILALSTDKNDPMHASWFQNAAGHWFSWDYAFGQLNVGKAVDLASRWKLLDPLQIRTFHPQNTELVPIVRNQEAIVEIDVPYGIVKKIESVQITLDVNIRTRGNIRLDLISPQNTTCLILPARVDNAQNIVNYVMALNCFLGEDPVGTWQLRAFTNLQLFFNPAIRRVALTVWGETTPSQVQPIIDERVRVLSAFTITEGDTFERLALFHDYPASVGLFWKDDFGLYGEVFDILGNPQSGTQRLNPSDSDHPTISVFPGGDHVLTYLDRKDQVAVMRAEVRTIGFIPLTPLTLALSNISNTFVSVAAIEANIIVSYKSEGSQFAKLALFDVDFGSRDTSPLCVPVTNLTTESDSIADLSEDGNCTEIVYRRDGSIEYVRNLVLQTQASVTLQSIGMNTVLGTWTENNELHGVLVTHNLTVHFTKFSSPATELIRATATITEILIAIAHGNQVKVEKYDFDLRLQESVVINAADPVTAIDIEYTFKDGFSLVIASTQTISITSFLRDYNGKFVQTNEAPLAQLKSVDVPVRDIDQLVMPNGDLALSFSTIQEIHVKMIHSSIFGTAPQPPMTAPVHVPITTQPPVSAPSGDVPFNAPVQVTAPIEEDKSVELERRMPSWAIALIILGGIMVLGIIFMIVWLEKKRRKRRRTFDQVVEDPLVAYTRMNA